MRVVTSIFLALAAVAAALGPAEAAPPGAGPVTPSPAPAQVAPQPATNSPAGGQPAAGYKPQAAKPTGARQAQSLRMGERRRRSYASCNRESHRRDLRGGARRRFLIRCKLGLERRASGPGSPAPAQPPGKRP